MWPTLGTIFLESKLKGKDITEEMILRSGKFKKKRFRTSTDNEKAREVLLSIRNILHKSKKLKKNMSNVRMEDSSLSLNFRENWQEDKQKLQEIGRTQRSVQFSPSVMSDYLRPHEPQHARPPCPSSTPGVHPNPCPLSRWRHPTISSSVIPFSSCPQSFPASGSFLMSEPFASGGQSIGASASVLPMKISANQRVCIA